MKREERKREGGRNTEKRSRIEIEKKKGRKGRETNG